MCVCVLWILQPIRTALTRSFATAAEITAPTAASATATATAAAGSEPKRAVAYWLFASCGLVFATVVVGGVTRLTGVSG